MRLPVNSNGFIIFVFVELFHGALLLEDHLNPSMSHFGYGGATIP